MCGKSAGLEMKFVLVLFRLKPKEILGEIGVDTISRKLGLKRLKNILGIQQETVRGNRFISALKFLLSILLSTSCKRERVMGEEEHRDLGHQRLLLLYVLLSFNFDRDCL